MSDYMLVGLESADVKKQGFAILERLNLLQDAGASKIESWTTSKRWWTAAA